MRLLDKIDIMIGERSKKKTKKQKELERRSVGVKKGGPRSEKQKQYVGSGSIKDLVEGRFSDGHYGFNRDVMYGDTGSIYILNDLGGEIYHMGFGDFQTKYPVKLPGVGEATIAYIRADGTKTGKEFSEAGFVGRPHMITFEGVNEKQGAKALGKLYAKAKCTLVKI